MTAPAATLTGDAVLRALQEARQQKLAAEDRIRLLLAYGRELARPRPYRLADLAEAAGLSLSGVRTAYGAADVEHAAALLGIDGDGTGCEQSHLAAVVSALLAAEGGR
jgi:hypothetical protein